LLLLMYAGKRPVRFRATCGTDAICSVDQPGSRVCALSHSRPARPCPAAAL